MNNRHHAQGAGAALPRGIIFDMDGVLFESGPYHRDSWFRLAQEEGLPGVTDQWFRDTFGMTGDDMICDLFGRKVEPKRIKQLMDRKEWHYRESARGHVVFPRGLRALLDGLTRRGWSIAIGSAGPRENVELITDELGIRSILAASVSSNDVTRGKPDPEVFLLAASRMGIPPARCVVVEDATVGVQAARAAGMKCLGITTTHPPEKLAPYTDRIIGTFEEIRVDDLERILDGGLAAECGADIPVCDECADECDADNPVCDSIAPRQCGADIPVCDGNSFAPTPAARKDGGRS